MKAMRRSGVMFAPRQGLQIADTAERPDRQRCPVAHRASATGDRSDGSPDTRSRRVNPSSPTSMLARPPSTKMASPIDAAANPIAAWPSRTSIQVSGSASSAQLEPSGSSTRSRTKCGLATRTVRSAVRRRRMAWRSQRPRMRNGDPVVFVQFALPAIVEQAECRVAALLNFGEHDAGADGVDGAGRDVDDVAFARRGASEPDRRSSRP